MQHELFCFLYLACKYDLYVFPQNSSRHIKCALISGEYKVINSLLFRIGIPLLKFPVHLNSFIQKLSIGIFIEIA